MDKYLYNKLRRLHRPGRGKQMKAEILQEFLVKALTERPKDLKAEFKAETAPKIGLVAHFNLSLVARFNFGLSARFNFGLIA